jgi:hypothetical protein
MICLRRLIAAVFALALPVFPALAVDKQAELVCTDAARTISMSGTRKLENQVNLRRPSAAQEARIREDLSTDPNSADFEDYDFKYVDIDNDGIPDIRAVATFGSASCERSYYWKRNVDGSVGPVIATFGEEADCGWSTEVVRFRRKNYLVQFGYRTNILELRGGEFRNVCQIEVRQTAATVTNECVDPLCEAAADLGTALYEEGKSMHQFAERARMAGKRISLVEASELIGPEATKDSRIRGDLKCGHDLCPKARLVDMDNDGIDELYVSDRGGRGNWLSYEVYKKTDGFYRKIDPEKDIRDFSAISKLSDYAWGELLSFIEIKGKTVVLSEKAADGSTRDNDRIQFHVFVIEVDGVSKLGSFTVSPKRDVFISYP